jgi:flagellar protein FlgJ
VSDFGKLPGVDALSSPNLSGWSAKLEAAQSAREQAEAESAAASLNKDASVAGKAGGKSAAEQAAQVQKVSRDFESLFLAYMLKTMKGAGPQSSFLGDTQGEKIFTEMRDEELAKGMAQAGGIGLANLLEQQLLQSLKGPVATPKDGVPLAPISPERKAISLDRKG